MLVGELEPFFNWQSSISRQIRHVFDVRVHERALNDNINYAQKGCAMQLWGITLISPSQGKSGSSEVNIIFPFPHSLKPWSNGLASSRKLKTWVHLRLRLARPCVHLRWLAMTCDHFGRDQICTQVSASFLPFGHPTQVNASSVTSINVWSANEIQHKSLLGFSRWRVVKSSRKATESKPYLQAASTQNLVIQKKAVKRKKRQKKRMKHQTRQRKQEDRRKVKSPVVERENLSIDRAVWGEAMPVGCVLTTLPQQWER